MASLREVRTAKCYLLSASNKTLKLCGDLLLKQDCRRSKIRHWSRLPASLGWLRSTVGRTPVLGQRTDPVLRSACSRRVTTMWINRLLQVSQLGQLNLSSFRGR